jgi:hypothetical protein
MKALLLMVVVIAAAAAFSIPKHLGSAPPTAKTVHYSKDVTVYQFSTGFCQGALKTNVTFQAGKCYDDKHGNSFQFVAARAYEAHCARAITFNGMCSVDNANASVGLVCNACNPDYAQPGQFVTIRNCDTGRPQRAVCKDQNCLDCTERTDLRLGECTRTTSGGWAVPAAFELCSAIVLQVIYTGTGCDATKWSANQYFAGNSCVEGYVFGVDTN